MVKKIFHILYIYINIYIYRYPSYFGSGVQHLMQIFSYLNIGSKEEIHIQDIFFAHYCMSHERKKLAKIKFLQKEKMAKINFCQEKKWQN